MKNSLLITSFISLLCCASCGGESHQPIDYDSAEATVANETGRKAPLPADVLLVTKPLISGQLYEKPSFESSSVISFDTSQLIQVLDTTHNIFVRARIRKDTISLIGYVPKTILPEKK